MTGGMLSLEELKTRVAARFAIAAITGVKIGSALDADYTKSFAEDFPSVWIAGQSQTPIDQGDGFGGLYRQNMTCDIVVMIVVRRYVDGDFNREAELNALANATANALLNFQPTGARKPIVWGGVRSGEPHDSLMIIEQFYRTEMAYQK